MENTNEVKTCWKCGRPAYEHCHSEAGKREVEISGLCEECFDKMDWDYHDEDKE